MITQAAAVPSLSSERISAAIPATEHAASDAAPRDRIERAAQLLRILAAILLLGPAQRLPNIGGVFVLTLGIFCLGYALTIGVVRMRAREQSDFEWAERFTLTVDISLVGFALLVFSADPGWAVYAVGFLVIASGGFRVRHGALLAAVSLSLSYLLIALVRAVELGLPVTDVHLAVQLGSYLIGGVLMNAVLPDLDAMRRREVDVYAPILRAHETSGDALLLTDGDRPVFWNEAFEQLTGYTTDVLSQAGSVAELVAVDPALLASIQREPLRTQMRRRDGRAVEVEISHPTATNEDREHGVWILRDVTDKARVESELRERALHDALTGLPNRLLLLDRLAAAIATARRRFGCVSVLFLDLDGFKQVNDELGHAAGDRVLLAVARRLGDALRETDTAARLGGDEFVVMLPGAPLAGGLEMARVITELIAQPVSVDDRSCAVGVSIGVAAFPEHGDDASTLLAAADAAMYDAKRRRIGCSTPGQVPA